jgi:hypothetical protein
MTAFRRSCVKTPISRIRGEEFPMVSASGGLPKIEISQSCLHANVLPGPNRSTEFSHSLRPLRPRGHCRPLADGRPHPMLPGCAPRSRRWPELQHSCDAGHRCEDKRGMGLVFFGDKTDQGGCLAPWPSLFPRPTGGRELCGQLEWSLDGNGRLQGLPFVQGARFT